MKIELLFLAACINSTTLFNINEIIKTLHSQIEKESTTLEENKVESLQQLEKLQQTITSIKESIAIYEQAKERNDALNLSIFTPYNGSTNLEQTITNLYQQLHYFESQFKKLKIIYKDLLEIRKK